jgi:hypothetical protein
VEDFRILQWKTRVPKERTIEHKTMIWMAVVAMGIVLVSGCGSDSDDVATLKTEEASGAEAVTQGAGEALDEEAMMMAFTECLREQGLEVMDPVVDADGNIGKPDFPEGADKETTAAAWEACEHYLAGFTSEQERKDVSEIVDQYVAFATCMRERGYDVEDPTAETLDQWDFKSKSTIDWNDPDAIADYEECGGETRGEGSGN